MVFTVRVPPLPVSSPSAPGQPASAPADRRRTPRADWSRRRLLGAVGRSGLGLSGLGLSGLGLAGAVGTLTGCSDDRAEPPPPRPADPLDPFVAAARSLADRYEAAIGAHPELTDRLGPLHAAHVAHVAALLVRTGRPERAPAPPDAPTGAPAPAGPAGSDEFAGWTPEQAVAALRDAEQDARAEAEAACLDAPADRAALLGSIAAARACHAAELT